VDELTEENVRLTQQLKQITETLVPLRKKAGKSCSDIESDEEQSDSDSSSDTE